MSPTEVFLWPFKKIWVGITFPFKSLSVILGSFGKIVLLVLLGAIITLIFQTPRDWLFDKVNRPEVSTAFTGTETVRSVLVSTMESFDVCELKPNITYTFVRATTESIDKVSYTIRNKRDGSTQVCRITGMFSDAPEKLPYPEGAYDFGILINLLPPGRRVKTNKAGCVKGNFNTNLAQFYEVSPIRMGFYFRE